MIYLFAAIDIKMTEQKSEKIDDVKSPAGRS